MPSKAPAAATPITHPPLGTCIDNDSLELVQVLGVGGYGVVYRAVDTLSQKSYAVKCLIQTQFHANSRQRQLHMREILLHQLASNHPNVVTLHRVVEQGAYTYIIMDYASDGDLFTQILNHRRYLGNDSLIRHVFLQMLDAVEYCHSLGIYHRDLKPENVLCFENGLRVAITDFGLATTDKVSDEFRTGSVYHMSPECQGGEFAPTGTYSPMFNDIWSLAIILLNLATGRNPWKSASANDPTFQAFLQDPISFLPTVLPISSEANQILVRMLEVDWRDRSTLSEVRQAIEDIETFYSPDAIFDGSMARCPWEAGMDIDAASDGADDEAEEEEAEAKKICLGDGIRMHNSPQSCWSDDSSTDLRFKQPSDTSQWAYYDQEKKWVLDDRTPPPTSPLSPDSSTIAGHGHFRASHHSLAYSASPSPSNSMAPSFPTTPNSVNLEFGDRIQMPKKSPLFINTECLQPRYYAAGHASDEDSLSSSMMQTACEGEDDSSFFLASPPSVHRGTRLSMISPVEFARNSAYDEDMMDYSFAWEYSSDTKASSLDSHQDMTTQSASTTIVDSPISPDAMRWPPFSIISEPQSYDHFQYSIVHTPLDGKKWGQPQHYPYAGDAESRSKASCGGGFFNTMKIFPQRQSPQSSSSRNTSAIADVSSHLRHPSEPFVTSAASQPRSFFASTAAPMTKNAAAVKGIGGAMMSTACAHQEQSCLRRNPLLRSPLHWFSPKQLFTSGAS